MQAAHRLDRQEARQAPASSKHPTCDQRVYVLFLDPLAPSLSLASPF
jgi:hypothetical protein